MKMKTRKGLVMMLASALCAILLTTPAFAAIPETGDGAGSLIPVMVGLLGVSLVLVIVYFVLSKKKK